MNTNIYSGLKLNRGHWPWCPPEFARQTNCTVIPTWPACPMWEMYNIPDFACPLFLQVVACLLHHNRGLTIFHSTLSLNTDDAIWKRDLPDNPTRKDLRSITILPPKFITSPSIIKDQTHYIMHSLLCSPIILHYKQTTRYRTHLWCTLLRTRDKGQQDLV